jgi:uncharacterized membrane protein
MSTTEERLDELEDVIKVMSDVQKKMQEGKVDPSLIAELNETINEDQKQDSQRLMAIAAMVAMLVFPFIILAAAYFGLDASLLVEISSMFYIAMAGVIAAFFGKEAYMSKHVNSP